MKAWDQFLKDVLPKVAGCPEPVAEHALLRAAQEFFAATRVWKIWLSDITTVLNTTEYDIELEQNTELVRIERATLTGRPIEIRTEDQLPHDWKTYQQGLATGIHTIDRRTMYLLPSQEAGLLLKIEASLKPSESATGIEDHLFAQYVRQIADGAVALLKEDKGTSYGDAVGALLYRDKFDGHIAEVDFQRYRGFSSQRPRRAARTF